MHSHKSSSAPGRPFKRRHHNVRPKRHHRTLRLEPLENRHLLAGLILGVQLWTDGGGPSGQPLKGTAIEPVSNVDGLKTFEVTAGSTFLVQFTAEDDRTTGENRGIISLPLDLAWNVDGPEVIHGSDSSPPVFPTAIPADQFWVTTQFDRQRLVDEYEPAAGAAGLRGGTIPELDGTNSIGVRGQTPPWGEKDDWRQFSLIRFRADTVGTSQVTVDLAGSMSFADAAPLDNSPQAVARIRVVERGNSSLSGFVYADVDKDGIRDVDAVGAPIEIGLPNVEIELYRGGTFVTSDRTGPDGWYHFEALEPGVYEIRQPTQPSCFLDGTETLGIILPSGESRGTAGDDRFTGIELRAGEAGIDYNFGELGLRASCINKGMLLGSSNLRQATVSDPLGVSVAVVRGTAQNDTVSVAIDTAAIRVTVNGGAPQTFPLTDGQVVTIDGLEGNDSIIVTGSSAEESGHFQPDYFTVRNDVCYPEPSTGMRCDWTWALEAIGFDDVTADAAAGQDLAVVRDSTGNDTLNAEGSRAVFGLTDRELEIMAFARVRAISTRGGSDAASVSEPIDYDLERLGDWT